MKMIITIERKISGGGETNFKIFMDMPITAPALIPVPSLNIQITGSGGVLKSQNLSDIKNCQSALGL